jgi:hypothetical protein
MSLLGRHTVCSRVASKVASHLNGAAKPSAFHQWLTGGVQVSVSIFACQPLRTQAGVGDTCWSSYRFAPFSYCDFQQKDMHAMVG